MSAPGSFSNDKRCFIFQMFGNPAQRIFYNPIALRRHFFLRAASAARHKNQAAVVRCGRQSSPCASSSFTVGKSRL